jgi:hypothetical protein
MPVRAQGLSLFGDRHGYIQFDKLCYIPTRLTDLIIAPVDRKSPRKYAAGSGLLENERYHYLFRHPVYLQIARYLVTIAGFHDLLGRILDYGVFNDIKPLIALGVLILQPIARIDRPCIDRDIEFGGGRILVVEQDTAFKTLEYTRSIIAGESDRIPIRYLPILRGDKGESASQQDQDGRGRI